MSHRLDSLRSLLLRTIMKTKELAWELFKIWTSNCKGLDALSKEQRLDVFEQVATWAQEAAITFEHTEI